MADQQVLEFTLNDETYCTDIEHVSEIVRRSGGDLTSVPNAPRHVEGVMDLRGEMTKIIDPREVLSLDEDADLENDKVIVFADAGDGDDSVGWAVADVTQVSTIDTENVKDVDEAAVKGIVNRDDGFLIWTEPETISTVAQPTP